MSVQPSPYINLIATDIANSLLKWWPDCTAEKIINLSEDYDYLTKWWIDTLKYQSPNGIVDVSVLPSNPKEGQVTLVDYGEYTYRYCFRGGHWSCVETRRTGMF